MIELDNFTKHYLVAALWSSTDDDCNPLDDNYNLSDIHPDSVQSAIDDCIRFQQDNKTILEIAYEFYNDAGMSSHPDAGSPEACAGHDYWLTRNHHGSGFWDRGMGPIGQELTEIAHKEGGVYLYVGDDEMLYFC